MSNPGRRIEEIDKRLEQLPKGTLTYKTINGKKQPYIQRTIEGKSVSYYVRVSEREQILLEFEERSRLLEEKKRLTAYRESLAAILKDNPYLGENVGVGYQYFTEIKENNLFYIDKTYFITEWLHRSAKISLITRPRRFGKTLLLSTVRTFLDPHYAEHPEYFEDLKVWQDPLCRMKFGQIPVISVSFGSCKGIDYAHSMRGMLNSLKAMYSSQDDLLTSERLEEDDRNEFKEIREALFRGEETVVENSIPILCRLVYKHYGIKPVILLDEYDTPLLEAYVGGYWEEMIASCRGLFHNTFKENEWFERAIITGVTKISRNSLFSDLNNIETYTITDEEYSDCFGFTEKEVEDALKCQNMDCFQEVKAMYDGFIFGNHRDIYNPWSICNFLDRGKLISYWINTSSNKIIGDIIRRHPVRSKFEIERLMAGEVVHKKINENITFQYMDGDENSLWSLLLAVGYIKADNVEKYEEYTECDVSVTNQEVMSMFRNEILGMFDNGNLYYNEFIRALLAHNTEEMEDILLDITYSSMSYFDTGTSSKRNPENFFHGLVLGLIVSLKDRYRIISNRESGRGRYDIALYPTRPEENAFIMEFKVFDERKEKDLAQTAANALRQIEEKQYEADMIAAGIPGERICKLGFAFEGKEVMVVKEKHRQDCTAVEG